MACLDDLITYIDNVEPLLESIRDKPCCPQVTTAPPGTEDIGGVDDSTAPPGDQDIAAEIIPPEFEDVDEYQQYLCGAANRIADATDGAVDAIYDTILLASNVVVFATLVVLAFGNVIGMGIAAVLAGGYSLVTFSEVFGFFSVFTELREALSGGDPGGIVPTTKSELAAAHDDIVNAIACANTPQEATADLHSVIDAAVTSSLYADMYKIMFNSLVMRAIWAGYMLDVTPSADCDCVEDILDFLFKDDDSVQSDPNHSNLELNPIDDYTVNFVGTRASGNGAVTLTHAVLYEREDCPQPSFPDVLNSIISIGVSGTIDVDSSTGSLNIDILGTSGTTCTSSHPLSLQLLDDSADVPTPGLGVIIDEVHNFPWAVAANRQYIGVQVKIGTSCQNYDLTLHVRVSDISVAE